MTKIATRRRTGCGGCPTIPRPAFQRSQQDLLSTTPRRGLALSSTTGPSSPFSATGGRTIRDNVRSSDKGSSIPSSAAAAAAADLLSRAVVKARGDLPYGSREYRLLVPQTASSLLRRRNRKSASKTTASIHPDDDDSLIVVATLRAHRNIIFGAALVAGAAFDSSELSSPPSSSPSPSSPPLPLQLVDVCSPLVEAALRDAGSQGEQPQAMATLHGLSAWVRSCLREVDDGEIENEGNGHLGQLLSSSCDSQVLLRLARRERPATEGDRVALQAVRAIATGVPRRTRHPVSSLGAGDDDDDADADDDEPLRADGGTMRDGRDLWIRLAREYAPLSDEVRLYRAHGAEVAAIELVGSNSSGNSSSSSSSSGGSSSNSSSSSSSSSKNHADEYMKSAGGAMARMFFL
jgi:hypothetical protein